ncbi:RNA polymerase II-associated protein 3 [Hypsizygus marmoreus]|uniref:RNA polymerase II-associated protein 3 n=1 Tax=Hypsizygus marmoreus TaxID=39966 RepID=A0A369IZV7_HYPMA|nr:RNA polymerase II-associated protein 3 [Hypsizygus marmoreus]
MGNKVAQSEKEKGNAAFKAGDYPNAIGHYTAAILADRNDFTFPLNRAAAYLKLGKNEDAERDCTTVLTLSALNPKALFRRGQARLGLDKLDEAMEDLTQALKREPANESVKIELKKAAELLEKKKAKGSKKSSAKSVSQPSPPAPRRRRIPITIVDDQPEPSTSTPSSSQPQQDTRVETTAVSPPSPKPTLAGNGDPLKAVSTRSLKPAESLPAPLKSPSAAPNKTPPPPLRPESLPIPARKQPDLPPTFADARRAREAVKPSLVGGGIFRKTGESTLFPPREGSPSTAAVPSVSTPPPAAAAVAPIHTTTTPAPTVVSVNSTPVNASPTQATAVNPPTTLFEFSRTWDTIRSTQERWNLISTIPPSSFPAFFKISLEPVLLLSILTVFNEVLRTGENASKVREYMDAFARVERFGTVVLFLSRAEKEVAREVWEGLGVTKEDVGRLWRPVWA